MLKTGEQREKEHEVKHHVEEVKEKLLEELVQTGEQREKEHEAKHHMEEVKHQVCSYALPSLSFLFPCLSFLLSYRGSERERT